MRAKAIATVLAAIAALTVLGPVASAGAAKTVHQPAETSAAAGGKAAQGFHFALFSIRRATVLLFYKRVGEGQETVGYIDPHAHSARPGDPARLDLKIGDRGHFRGHFVATSTKTRKPRKGCEGDPSPQEDGYFAGSFVFHGERGYTAIHASRLQGAITRQGAEACRAPNARSGVTSQGIKAKEEAKEAAAKAAEEDEYRLLAGDRTAHLLFQATREQVPPEPGSGAVTSFTVTSTGDRAGPFTISRSVALFDDKGDSASTFLTPNPTEPLAEATVEPPAPFSGSASFLLEGPKKAGWAGDLAVELPGAGKVALTGRKIYAGTCRGRTNCTETLPRPLAERAVLDPGSQLGVGEVTTTP